MTNFKPIIVGVEGAELSAEERALFKDERPAGLILFRRNCEAPRQVKDLIASFRDAVGNPDALVLIDQEGGRVARLQPPHWRQMPPAALYGRMAQADFVEAAAALQLATTITSMELQRLGINVNCAPVLDVPIADADAIIGDRAFSHDPQLVSRLGRVCVDAMVATGILPVIKHIPGHGRALLDSHEDLPFVDADMDSLMDRDFLPFKSLSDAPMAMTAHIVYEAIDPDRPATLSSKVIEQIVRGDIGFEGLLLSDDITMKALEGPMAKRTLSAFEAGCDLVLHCSGVFDEMREILQSASPVNSALKERVSAALALIETPEPQDLDNASARLSQMIGAWA